MTNNGDDRSVTARDITGSSVVTGDRNTVSTTMTQLPLPPPETVNVASELAALRELLGKLNVPDRGKLDRAMQDATEETAKPKPDKEEVAGAVGRVVKYAKAADDFGQHAEKLLPRIAALGSWLGTHGASLLALAGIAI
jgi:hypothetical protein